MDNKLSDQIRELVKQNKLQKAAELLFNSSLSKKGIIESARLKDLRDRINKGLVRFEDQNIELNNIRVAILEATDELETLEKQLIKPKGWLILSIIVVIAVCGGLYLFLTTPDCDYDSKYTLAIANFSKGEERPFSGRLVKNLDAELSSVSLIDSTRITSLYKYIEHEPEKIEHKIKRVEKNNCISKGLIVYGTLLKEDGMLDCYIRLINMKPKRAELKGDIEKVRLTENTLKVPNEISFTIPEQAEKVSDFIIGLLNYYEGNPDLAIKHLNDAKEKTVIDEDPRYHNICNLLIGNSYQALEKPDSAISSYQKILVIDSTFTTVYWNLTLAYIDLESYSAAIETFNKFTELNQAELSDNELKVAKIFTPDKLFEVDSGYIYILDTSLDSRYILTGGEKCSAIIWDTLGNKISQFTLGDEKIICGDISHNMKYLIIAGINTAKIISIPDFKVIKKFTWNGGDIINEHILPKVYFSQDSKHFIWIHHFTFDDKYNSVLYNFKENKLTINNSNSNIYSISPTENYFLSYEQNEKKNLLIDSQGKILSRLGSEFISSPDFFFPSFSHNGKYITIGNSSDNELSIFDLNGKEIQVFNSTSTYKNIVISADVSGDDKYVITSNIDGTIRVWDFSGIEILKLLGSEARFRNAFLSHNGKYLIAGGEKHWMIWDFKKLLKYWDRE